MWLFKRMVCSNFLRKFIFVVNLCSVQVEICNVLSTYGSNYINQPKTVVFVPRRKYAREIIISFVSTEVADVFVKKTADGNGSLLRVRAENRLIKTKYPLQHRGTQALKHTFKTIRLGNCDINSSSSAS